MKLTRESIMSMEPGRELDALVAANVFGWHYGTYHPELRHYSTDISAAWEVVDRMSPQTMYMTRRHSDVWLCEFHGYPLVEGNAAPETICKAALLAKLEAEE